jgi:hypothetical protein
MQWFAMQWGITHKGDEIRIEAGFLVKVVSVAKQCPEVVSLTIGTANLLEMPTWEARVAFHLAEPDEEPRGIPVSTGMTPSISQENVDRQGTDGLHVSGDDNATVPLERVVWHRSADIEALHRDSAFGEMTTSIEEMCRGSRRVAIHMPITKPEDLAGVKIEIIHEIYEGHPVIRKWLVFKNDGIHWIKIDQLSIEPFIIDELHLNRVNLTPDERGASSSIVAFEDKHRHEGVILCSEVPSALREMGASGSMGYKESLFEWVLGPGERFETEPVSIYAYRGDVIKTPSAVSAPLDRTVEGSFRSFLETFVGIRCVPERMPVPLWCTWSNFQAAIDDSIIRDQARIASKAGFRGFQIDAGWSNSDNPADWTSGGREPHPGKFPDFQTTCEAVRHLGLHLGLWTSCFRNVKSPDLREMPEGKSYPEVKRGECFGMSFASKWRYYYADDVVKLHDTLGATYFKQDLTNIKFGDIAEGHDSRTRKESYLRGIRGFFEAQDIIHQKAPGACTLLSHELYWGTPGTPCDVAAAKHCWSFHIPPNDYSGAFPRKERIARKETRLKLNRWLLLAGCFNARRRFYAHRGLPLYCIEYYGAATVNKDGSLEPRIQDRQVCSWLMGIPSVYAGDLSSLTGENILHYKKRFDMIVSLQERHGIFRYFQYSGVPAPTDTGWHWWGKLNPAGSGVVVVMRGWLGAPSRRINVPWVPDGKRFKVTALFAGKELGMYSSEQLKSGMMRLSLPRLSQEILEIIVM